jgi:hypothetical protein
MARQLSQSRIETLLRRTGRHFARNRRLGGALFLQAYSALRTSPEPSPLRPPARGATHYQSLRTLANRPAYSMAAYEATPATTSTMPGTANSTNSALQTASQSHAAVPKLWPGRAVAGWESPGSAG